MNREVEESYISYVDRLSQSLADGMIDYQEWSEGVLGEAFYGPESLRRCYQFFSKFLEKLDEEEIKQLNGDSRVEEIRKAQEELIRERKRLQTVNLEAQEYYRVVGRNELFNEQILEAIRELKPVEVKAFKHTASKEKTGLLVISDQHYDSTFEVSGLFGEVVNKYNKEIFKTRMWNLLAQMDADNYDYDDLLIVSCGDALEGLLRMTSLQKLRTPVVKATMEFAEFMAVWLEEASSRLAVPIIFQLIGGNHDVTRSLTSKPEFPEENLAVIIHEFIRLRLINSQNVNIEPYGDIYFKTLYSSNLMFAHGECGNLEDLANYFEELYKIDIDTLYAGHLHRNESKAIGVGNMGDREVIRVGSICGLDPYGKSIRKNGRASATFAVYSENGKELQKAYFLN